MNESPDNKNRPENDADIYMSDMIHSHRFKRTLTNSLFKEIAHGTGELTPLAENALEIWTYAKSIDITINEASVQLGLDFEDPTHQVYIETASFLDYFYSNNE